MTKEEAQVRLRQLVDALDIDDLARLVKVASEGINDIPACGEIADMVCMSSSDLQAWGERVLHSVNAEIDLSILAEMSLGWYDNVAAT